MVVEKNIYTVAGQRDRVLRDGEDVECDGHNVARLPVGLHLRAQRRVAVEALHPLDPTQGLSPVDSVSITRYFILIFLRCSFDVIYIHYNYILYDAFMTLTSYK